MYICNAQCPELDSDGSYHCVVDNPDEMYEMYGNDCPCGNKPNWVEKSSAFDDEKSKHCEFKKRGKIITNLSEWAKNYYDVHSDGELCMLERHNNTTVFFMTKEKYLCKNFYYYTTPVYHVWYEDKNVCSTTDYHTAYLAYITRVENRQQGFWVR